MDVTSCKGKTAGGLSCNRTTRLNDQGYCFQHSNQQQQQKEGDAAQSSSDKGSQEEEEGEVEEEEEEVEEVEEEVEAFPQCQAVAATTKQRCKKLVSVAQERFCPAHGGQQLKIKLVRAPCQAVSHHSNSPCKSKVSAAREIFCRHHGGKSKSARKVQLGAIVPAIAAVIAAPAIPQQQQQPQNNDVNWAQVQGVCLQFVMETHPQSGCQCTPDQPCKQFALVKWVQRAAKVAQRSPGGLLVAAITTADLAPLAPENNNDLFADLFLAVQLFGGDNMTVVSQVFQRIQQQQQAPSGDKGDE
jgi:hypothetical protein